ncbi:MAG: ferredoxin [Rhodospirillales bacterium CG15_BIG_FIL_POST_REV_8_21_14_020_66_15]|nr:MAG: ferredoxin [Rhodospirillales bacterium CG15_BIG_FIL_POST_REV_8_21_14_020_66_15]
MDLSTIERRIAATGLLVRGGFHPGGDDAVPGNPATLILVGDVAGRLWPHFNAARRDEADPLDSWTRRVLDPAATDLGARIVYPFDGPPHHPFQRWAMRAEGLRPSPIGPLAHPEFGLWHSYRAALLFGRRIDLGPPPPADHPCDGCADKPCLGACPVEAFDGRGFSLPACLGHLRAPQGRPCMTGGCLARHACPVGAEHAYGADHQAFVAQSFLAAFGR